MRNQAFSRNILFNLMPRQDSPYIFNFTARLPTPAASFAQAPRLTTHTVPVEASGARLAALWFPERAREEAATPVPLPHDTSRRRKMGIIEAREGKALLAVMNARVREAERPSRAPPTMVLRWESVLRSTAICAAQLPKMCAQKGRRGSSEPRCLLYITAWLPPLESSSTSSSIHRYVTEYVCETASTTPESSPRSRARSPYTNVLSRAAVVLAMLVDVFRKRARAEATSTPEPPAACGRMRTGSPSSMDNQRKGTGALCLVSCLALETLLRAKFLCCRSQTRPEVPNLPRRRCFPSHPSPTRARSGTGTPDIAYILFESEIIKQSSAGAARQGCMHAASLVDPAAHWCGSLDRHVIVIEYVSALGCTPLSHNDEGLGLESVVTVTDCEAPTTIRASPASLRGRAQCAKRGGAERTLLTQGSCLLKPHHTPLQVVLLPFRCLFPTTMFSANIPTNTFPVLTPVDERNLCVAFFGLSLYSNDHDDDKHDARKQLVKRSKFAPVFLSRVPHSSLLQCRLLRGSRRTSVASDALIDDDMDVEAPSPVSLKRSAPDDNMNVAAPPFRWAKALFFVPNCPLVNNGVVATVTFTELVVVVNAYDGLRAATTGTSASTLPPPFALPSPARLQALRGARRVREARLGRLEGGMPSARQRVGRSFFAKNEKALGKRRAGEPLADVTNVGSRSGRKPQKTKKRRENLGTCAMKPRNEMGVVDERLNVYGVQGLKVADQMSIPPSNVAANTYGTALPIGEKAALIIAEELRLGIQCYGVG
ncbi:hypothetical protein C8R46DRAFT_1035963 [Mycena filopes]|nr:hypothetical protein C8R46DRAFT_1035963 [Mycena filopes]